MKCSKLIKILKVIIRNFSFKFIFQIFNPKNIPIIIINFNQLATLQILINFLLNHKFSDIIVIDNNSSYPPLLQYYKQIEKKITIHRLETNSGHMVLFQNRELYEKYCKNMFIMTDPDIIPNHKLPKNFISIMIKYLLLFYNRITKVGFALRIDDIPENYPAKEKVLKWESQFWINEVEKNIFETDLDSTFALYKPDPIASYKSRKDYYKSLRIAGDFTCKHMGWYIDYENLSDEQKYYQTTATSASSWKVNKDGSTNSNIY